MAPGMTASSKSNRIPTMPGKLKEPTTCKACGAIYHKGRWSWGVKQTGADEIVCPACLRIQDKSPKGHPICHTTGTRSWE